MKGVKGLRYFIGRSTLVRNVTNLSTTTIMGKSLGRVFLTIVVSISLICAASGQDTKQGHFQVLQNHPDIKVCANDVLKENAYVGGRVSELTGKCYGLPHSWGLNPKIESGYAYVKKTFVQENFQPPSKVGNEQAVSLMIPGVFHPGAKLHLFISMQVKENNLDSVWVILSDTLGICDAVSNSLFLHFHGSKGVTYVDITEKTNDKISLRDINVHLSASELSKEMLKISFLAHSGSASILINDKKLKTFQTQGMIGKRQICVKKWYTNPTPISVHRIEFAAK